MVNEQFISRFWAKVSKTDSCWVWQGAKNNCGYGYDEGPTHQQTCWKCDKTFAYTTAISFHYETAKADCMNGGAHNYKEVKQYGWPEPRTLLRCIDCDHQTQPMPSNAEITGG